MRIIVRLDLSLPLPLEASIGPTFFEKKGERTEFDEIPLPKIFVAHCDIVMPNPLFRM
jgi:hypothetical protein